MYLHMRTVIKTMERLIVTLKQSDKDGNDVGDMELHTDTDGDAETIFGQLFGRVTLPHELGWPHRHRNIYTETYIYIYWQKQKQIQIWK